MPPFRDDREALRQRVEELEAEARELRGEERKVAEARVAELEQRLSEVLAETDEHRQELASIARKVAAVRTELSAEASPPAESSKEASAARPARKGRALWALALLAIGAAGVVAALSRGSGKGFSILPSPTVQGRVDPLSWVEVARKEAGLRSLAAIQAWVIEGGVVDADAPQDPNLPSLRLDFSEGQTAAAVTLDGKRLVASRSPLGQSSQGCGTYVSYPCATTVPVPRCNFRRVWEIAREAGATKEDRLFVMYAQSFRSSGSTGTPTWTVIAALRGKLEIDDARCERPTRQNIQPPARPVRAIPGAPYAVDPLGVLELARAQAGLDADAVLTGIDIRFVGPNGRVKLVGEGYEGSVLYTFADPEAQPDATRPPGVPAPDPRRRRQVYLSKDGMPITPNDYDSDLYATLPTAPVAPPSCSAERVHALAALPSGAIAQMSYRAAATEPGRPGRWTVEVLGSVSGRVVEDAACAKAR